MNSKNIIIGALILTTVAGGVWGWTQSQRAKGLAAQVAKLSAPPAKTSSKHSSRPAGGDAQSQSKKPATDKTPSPDTARPPSSSAIRNLLQSPKAAQLLASQQRAMIESRYAALFKTLDLPPDQLAKFKDLLVEKQNAARDVMTVAREQGLDFRKSDDRSEIQQLVQQAQADVDNSISSVIGADKLAQYQNYDQTAPQRAIAGEVSQRLSYTSEPLTSAQNDQLVALLAQNSPPQDSSGVNRTFVFSNVGGPVGGGFGGMGQVALGQGVPITNQVIDAAQSFLSPAQVDTLRQIQAEQSDQQQLQKMFMNGSGGGSGGSSKYKSKSRSGGGGGNGN